MYNMVESTRLTGNSFPSLLQVYSAFSCVSSLTDWPILNEPEKKCIVKYARNLQEYTSICDCFKETVNSLSFYVKASKFGTIRAYI